MVERMVEQIWKSVYTGSTTLHRYFVYNSIKLILFVAQLWNVPMVLLFSFPLLKECCVSFKLINPRLIAVIILSKNLIFNDLCSVAPCNWTLLSHLFVTVILYSDQWNVAISVSYTRRFRESIFPIILVYISIFYSHLNQILIRIKCYYM